MVKIIELNDLFHINSFQKIIIIIELQAKNITYFKDAYKTFGKKKITSILKGYNIYDIYCIRLYGMF